MKLFAGLTAILACSALASAGPLLPTIIGHDFSYGAYNADGAIEYATHGLSPDTLIYTQNPDDHEVISYWPDWPSTPVYPVFDLSNTAFGGDFVLQVQFTGQDAPIGNFDVSLTGTGLNASGADLEIFGTIDFGSFTLSGLLWALELDDVSLYGYSDHDTYSLEGIGSIVGGLVADHYNLVGLPGAMRGDLDFINRPAGWLPPQYDPLANPMDELVRAAYSGETGLIPEPAAVSLLVVGLGALLRRR